MKKTKEMEKQQLEKKLCKKVWLNAFWVLCMIGGMTFTAAGCGGDDDHGEKTSRTTTQDANAGVLTVTNKRTAESKTIASGNKSTKLIVKGGDEIEVAFVPKGEYGDYTFAVAYTLPDGSTQRTSGKSYSYTYTVPEVVEKALTIGYEATVSHETTTEVVKLSASGEVTLDTEEKNLFVTNGGGTVVAVNRNTGASIEAEDGTFYVGSAPTLTASPGDQITMTFRPKEQYAMYPFELTYTMPDGTILKGSGSDYACNYTVPSSLGTGEHRVSFTDVINYVAYHVSVKLNGDGGFILKVE